MKYTTSSEKVKELDRKAVDEWGIPAAVLMENAGRSAVELINEEISPLPDRALVISGKGNNGGDGLVVARRLIDQGVRVKTFILAEREELTGETERNAGVLERITNEVFYTETSGEELLKSLRSNPPLVVDSIFGIGIQGELRGDYPELISAINQSNGQIVAIDLPSGLPADSGNPPGKAVRADLTVTMGFLKRGTLVPKGRQYTGKQLVASVGYPEKLLRKEGDIWEVMDDQLAGELLPTRSPGGHKGTFGRLLVVGGSPGMTGAPILAARSGLRTGTGLVYLAGPEEANEIFSNNIVEGLKIPLPDTKGRIGLESLDSLFEAAEGKDGLAVGPGTGRKKITSRALRKFLAGVSQPKVLDADGVVAFSDAVGDLREIDNLVLTPHPGELSALLDFTPEEVDQSRFQLVPELARDLGVTLLLKGVPTVIGSPCGEVSVINCSNSGLAKGGSGDVLTGLIGGFLAQGLKPYAAARLGGQLHCRIGRLGVEELGTDSLQPGDMIELINEVLSDWRSEKKEKEL